MKHKAIGSIMLLLSCIDSVASGLAPHKPVPMTDKILAITLDGISLALGVVFFAGAVKRRILLPLMVFFAVIATSYWTSKGMQHFGTYAIMTGIYCCIGFIAGKIYKANIDEHTEKQAWKHRYYILFDPVFYRDFFTKKPAGYSRLHIKIIELRALT